MSTFVYWDYQNEEVIVVTKGQEGPIRKLLDRDNKLKYTSQNIEDKSDNLASKGLRILHIATKKFPRDRENDLVA